jgi:threonine dehydratase
VTLAVSPSDIAAAATAIRGGVIATPSAVSRTLSEITGAEVVVKFESLQFTASFKERGALNRLLQLSAEERRSGVVTMSAGNHGQAVAFHARNLGVAATIVVPQGTPFVKVARTEALGARVLSFGETFDESSAYACELAERDGLVMIRPFDEPAVIAGQGTVALELLDAYPELDLLVVPVGGGGLIAGMAVAAKDRRPDIEVVGVQSELYPSVASALGKVAGPGAFAGQTIADGIAVKAPGELTLPIIRALVDDVVCVGEERIEEAIGLYLEIEKVVAEGAGAAGLAALLEDPDRFRGKRVGLVLSGANIDPRLLASVVMRGLVRSGRLTAFHVRVSDVPGSLAKVTALIGEHGGNIIEVQHVRNLSSIPARYAELSIAIETRDRAHAQKIAGALEAAGFEVTVEGTSR